jgi:2-dehydropantoate 2-reductase
MEINTVAIIGLGALGVMYGHAIERRMPAGTVRFVSDGVRAERYRTQGILCNGEPVYFTLIAPDAETPPADLLLFAVKAPDLPHAIADARSQVGENTTVLSLLNGIESERQIAAAYGAEKVLYCVAQGMDATKIGAALTFSKTGVLQIGTGDGQENDRLRAVAAFLDRAGIRYEILSDIHRQIWSKFMLNCGVNQVAMVYDVTYRGLQTEGEPRAVMLAAVREVLAIAQKAGLDLSEKDITYWMQVLDTMGPDGRPSMGQDRIAKRRSEVETFGGAVSRLGREYGVPTPVNDRLTAQIRKIEAAY